MPIIDTGMTRLQTITMRNVKRQPKPTGIIILKQIQKHEWIFEYPRFTEDVHDLLEDAIDWIDSDVRVAKLHFRRLIREYPEHLDAYHHLALTWYRQGKLEKAAELWKEGIEFAMKLFPAHFSMTRDRLIWGFHENRPFLRLYHSYGLSLLRKGEAEKALEAFENIVALNPNDNQGARALVAECYFELKRPEGVLEICNQYRNDGLEQLIYGRVLALLQLGNLQDASKALKRAIKHFPLVANELCKSTHKQPKDYDEEHVTLWSEGQAYGYWKEFGKYWTSTAGAIEFVRSELKGGK
jgi:tetratricopeptide (TPR) repeat protein